MEPYALDASLKRVTLEYADKNIKYWHGPIQGAAFIWPTGGGQTMQANLEFEDLHNIVTKAEARGEWALFRLLQGGSIKRQEGNRCLIEVQKNGKWAQFLIQFRNKVNPFDPAVCSFALPEMLLP
jgi:type VI secretion system protein ImpL